MRTLTPTERRARALAVVAESERTGVDVLTAIKTVNRRLFSETARPARPVTKTTSNAAAKPAARSDRKVKPKDVRKAARILQQLRESQTAAATPAVAPARQPARSHAPERSLRDLADDELGGQYARTLGADRDAPVWRRLRESARPAPILESELEAPPADKPLHQLSDDELAATGREAFAAHARTHAFASPGWVA